MVYYGILQSNPRENAMPRKSTPFSINPADRPRIEEVFACKSESRRRVDRCRILLGLEAGRPAAELALQCSVTPNTVRNVRRRYEAHGLSFLDDLPRSGHPFRYTPEDEAKILAQIDEPPPPGCSSWDGASLASALGFSDDFVWATLRKHGICLQRRRSWCVSTDPEFDRKAADVVGLYLNPPENAIVISVDEKPGIQALTRKQGFVHGRDGRVLRAYKSTYRRNGTLNLFAALKVAGGEVFGRVTQRKTRDDFLAFMDALLADQAGDTVPCDAGGGSRIPCHPGQLLHPQEKRRMAGGASKCPFPLYAHVGKLAEPGGDMVQHYVQKSASRLKFRQQGSAQGGH